jgi:hypothetical protein
MEGKRRVGMPLEILAEKPPKMAGVSKIKYVIARTAIEISVTARLPKRAGSQSKPTLRGRLASVIF